MTELDPQLMQQVRARFAYVDTCPFQGSRIFFENAGGALTLNSVVETQPNLRHPRQPRAGQCRFSWVG